MGNPILIVDDDDGVRQWVRLQLQAAGFASVVAATAEEAQGLLKRGDISIVITDIHLPGMSGLDLVVWIKQNSEASVIALTGYVNEYSYEQVVGRGASDFLIKPVRPQELIMRLKRVIAERDLRQTRDKLLQDFQTLAITDGLTGLFNSRHFHNQLDVEISRAGRYSRKMALLLVDVDHFKRYNDTYGHLEGNKALIKLAQALKSCLRGADSAFRYGGEEFTALLPETTCGEAVTVGKRICEQVALTSLDPLPDKIVQLTVSIGATEYVPNEGAMPFIRRADQAMYKSKENGRNQVTALCDKT